jgi:hypothetical protein
MWDEPCPRSTARKSCVETLQRVDWMQLLRGIWGRPFEAGAARDCSGVRSRGVAELLDRSTSCVIRVAGLGRRCSRGCRRLLGLAGWSWLGAVGWVCRGGSARRWAGGGAASTSVEQRPV